MARKEMQTLILRHPPKLTILTIIGVENNREFQRIHNKEFRYKGIMYDIVREIKTGQTTVFICIQDDKETKLVAGLNRVNHNKLLFTMWDHLVMIYLTVPTIDLNPAFSGNLIFPQLDIALKSSMLPTWSPPPKYS